MENGLLEAHFSLNHPGSISFGGSAQAELFTKIVSESLQGVLHHNYVTEGDLAGFIHSSIQGRPWDGTMWTRDAGTILRELVCFGYFGHAALTARYLIAHCGLNEKGYHTFPMYFLPGKVEAGDELDGTFSILIGFSLLYPVLKTMDTAVAQDMAAQILQFLVSARSPLRFVVETVKETGLLAGTGEFGGGMGAGGKWINSVQNALAIYTLRSCAQVLEKTPDLAQACRETANMLEDLLHRYLVKDGKFIWCVSERDLQPDAAVLNTVENKGFAGINGIGAMSCDGQVPVPEWIMQTAENTYTELLEHPVRKEQFEKYGIYTQFDLLFGGFLSSPSYGQGYALQLALLLGRTGDAARLLNYLVKATVNPPEGYTLTRTNPYWTYERFLTPDYFAQPLEKQTSGEGCGALNVVNVAEPLKAARLLAGVEYKPSAPKWIEGINRVTLEHWPMLENGELKLIDREYAR